MDKASARELIEDIIRDNVEADWYGNPCGQSAAAGAILAAMPEIVRAMVKPLVWDNSTRHGRRVYASGDYALIENYPNGKTHFCIQYRGLPMRYTANYPTREGGVAVANAHNAAQIMEGLGVAV